jgi:putative phosphoribosyl transferase
VNVYSRHTADRAVGIPVDGVELKGELFLPDAPTGLVLFAHGAGSDRHSPRSRVISDALTAVGIATLLFDLLTPPEVGEDRWKGHLSFDIPFLARRLAAALEWAGKSVLTRELGVGLFGAGTGAAAALWVAADRPLEVQAVVSRGGRPDLVADQLSHVVAPTLLIIGRKRSPLGGLESGSAQSIGG